MKIIIQKCFQNIEGNNLLRKIVNIKIMSLATAHMAFDSTKGCGPCHLPVRSKTNAQ